MHEQELEKIIESLRVMEGRFEAPTTAAAPHLNSADRAAFKRLILEAKGILQAALGINDFGVPLLQMTNLPGFGAFNPPMLDQFHEAIGLVEGGLNQVRRRSRQLRKHAIGDTAQPYTPSKSMSIVERIRAVEQEMTALLAEGLSPQVKEPLEALRKSAETVGKSWSGSWLGYQANVYYRGLKAPPAGANFSKEWGLKSAYANDTTGEWEECRGDDVLDQIFSMARSPDREALTHVADEAGERAMDGKASLISFLAPLQRAAPEDEAFKGMLRDLNRLKLMDVGEILASWKPHGQLITRDSLAASQGVTPPGHLRAAAIAAALNQPFAVAKELAKLAKNMARHAEALNIGVGPMIQAAQPNRIFIGHGGSPLWRELKDHVKDELRLQPDEFNRVAIAGVSTADRLKQMLDDAAFAFLVLTAEDERSDGGMQARMNVIHEVGLFQGRLGFHRAIVLLEEGCAEFSNINGLGQLRFPKGKISAIFHDIDKLLVREGLLAPR